MEQNKIEYGERRYEPVWTITEKSGYDKGKLRLVQLQSVKAITPATFRNAEGDITKETEYEQISLQLRTAIKDFKSNKWTNLNLVKAEDKDILGKVWERYEKQEYDKPFEKVQEAQAS